MTLNDARVRAPDNQTPGTGGAGATATSLRRVLTLAPLSAIGLAGALLVASLLDLLDLGRDGFANTYYAAAVRSMAAGWHTFFFSSFDPGGFVTIDKPPLGFWLQVLSVKLLGFRGISLLLPQALAGVLSVALLFYLVQRRFGGLAAFVAALALAVTPISVATNRNNTVDSLLAFTLLLAAGCVLFALEQGSLRWLLLGMALVGIGFNIKMAEALVALPALGIAYLLAAPLSLRIRLLHLVAAGAVLVMVGLSWVTIVDLVPAAQRPYVGSSQHNSELELAVGYNGINRLLPRRFFGARPGQAPLRAAAAPVPAGIATNRAAPSAQPPVPFRGPGGRPANGGLPPLLRLFSFQLAGQLSWLIPFAAAGLIAGTWQARSIAAFAPRRRALLLWGGWFVCCGLLFTFDQAARPYYMVTFSPAIAALTGIGVAAMWDDYRAGSIRGWLLPAALAAGAAAEAFILMPYSGWNHWLTPLILVAAGAATTLLIVVRLTRSRAPALLAAAAAAVGVLALFAPPSVWSAVTVARAAPGGMPAAGPATTAFGFPGPRPAVASDARAAQNPGASPAVDSTLLAYLQAHRDGAKYLVATPNAQAAAPLIIQTGQPVMALGGFAGSDPILTSDELAQDVQNGTVRFFLMPAAPNPAAGTGATAGRTPRSSGTAGPPEFQPPEPGQVQALRPPAFAAGRLPGFFGRAGALDTWVSATCAPVPADQWRSSDALPARGGFGVGFGGSQQLYDCASA